MVRRFEPDLGVFLEVIEVKFLAMRNSFFYRLLPICSIMQILKKRRVTVSINADLEMKIRTLQAQIIGQTSRSTSFSSVLNEILNEAFKAQVDIRVHKRFTPELVNLWT